MVFYLGWAQGFPRKNSCVHYFRIIYLLPSQEQPARSGELTVCENQARTEFTPSCVLYSKSQQSECMQFEFYMFVLFRDNIKLKLSKKSKVQSHKILGLKRKKQKVSQR